MAEHVVTITQEEARCTCGFEKLVNHTKLTPLAVTRHIQNNEIDVVVYDLRDNKG